MNGQLFLQCMTDVVLRDATKRVLGNIITSFEDLSGKNLGQLVGTSVNFLGQQIPNITKISCETEIESFPYTIGRANFDKEVLEKVCTKMEGKWIISVDESIVDKESFVGEVAYRHSCAFGYQVPKPETSLQERVLAVSSILRLQDEEDFDNKMRFLPYLLNLYVAYYTAKILQSLNEPIFAVILHGPLIRHIGPFLNLLFRKEDIKSVVTADADPPGEIADEVKKIADGRLLDLIVAEPSYQDSLNQFIDLSSSEQEVEIQTRLREGDVPGICFYFSLLRKLSDLANEMNFHLIGCVESTSFTEYSNLYMQYQIERFGQEPAQQEVLAQLYSTFDVENFGDLIKKSGWDDEMVQSFSLEFDRQSVKSEFTQPVPIRRYFPSRRNEDIFKIRFGCTGVYESRAQENVINQILDALYPFKNYRMLMSFVRTSELKAPIRVEFLEQGDRDDWREILASIYVASLPYSSYGLPIFLYYADKMVRTPKKIISNVTESYMFEQATRALHQLELSDTSLRQFLLVVTQKFRRDFYERG